MSHRIQVKKLKLTDQQILRRAAELIGATLVQDGEVITHRLYNATVEGVGVHLPGWRYPVIVDKDGNVHYDNYQGHWGDQKQLDKLLQKYVEEKAKHDALMYGFTVENSYINDKGETVLEIEVPE